MYSEQDETLNEIARLHETVEDIKSALTADDFNDEDRREVIRSEQFFIERREQLERSLAEGSLISAQYIS